MDEKENHSSIPRITGNMFRALRNYYNYSQEQIALGLGFRDRGVIRRLENEDIVPPDIVKNFVNIINVDAVELDEIIHQLEPTVEYEQKIEQQEEFTTNEKERSMDSKVSKILFDNFHESIKGKDQSLDSLQKKNEDLSRELNNSQNQYY